MSALRSRPVLATPTTLVDVQQGLIHEARDRARRSLGHRLDRAGDEVGHHLARIRALSPLATLERGYGVAQLPDGTVITSVGQVDAEAEFTVRVSDGLIGVRTLTTETIRSASKEGDHG